MAEGFARKLAGDAIEVHSAGLLAAGVHRRAIAVMQEVGIDISGQRSQVIDPDLLSKMDVVITLCDHAEESCPWTPPSIRRYHWPIKDPVGTTGPEKTIMKEFRRARDEIRSKIQTFIADMDRGKPKR